MEFINKILSGLKIQGTGKLKLCLVDSKARTVQERNKSGNSVNGTDFGEHQNFLK